MTTKKTGRTESITAKLRRHFGFYMRPLNWVHSADDVEIDDTNIIGHAIIGQARVSSPPEGEY